MINIDYLKKGLNALARAHLVNLMSGHLGAAVVAGFFIGEQHRHLDDRVCRGIKGEIDRIIMGESVFSPGNESVLNATEMFVPFPDEASDTSLIDGIAYTLAGNINKLRESGHNVIFASIAIRALKEYPDLARPEVIDGILRLIAGFNDASPGSGYYGRQAGRINGNDIVLNDDLPHYSDLQGMCNAVFDELIDHTAPRREGFGGLFHIINHAAALVELDCYGYRDLALKGLTAHHQHMMLFRSLPDVSDERGVYTTAEYSPLSPEFWTSGKICRERALLTHRIKTMYGFYVISNLIEDEAKRNQGIGMLRLLM